MFKQLITLARGRSADAADALMDANALSILRQQLRDSAAGVEQSRKALAVVMAYAEREKRALEKIQEQITTLETRALAALEQGKEDLAADAAEAIAELEAEADATQKTITTYTSEISRMRACLRESETQLVELKRGQRLAEANEKTIKVRGALPNMAQTDLEDAAQTLKNLQARQDHATATAQAMEALSTRIRAESVDDRLAAAGCGAPKQSNSDAVLARLKARKSS